MKAIWLILTICLTISSQSAGQILDYGPYHVGFKRVDIQRDSITIALSIWYPTSGTTGDAIPLIDFTWNQYPADVINDSIKQAQVNALRRSIEKWFGPVTDERWSLLGSQRTASFANAPPHSGPFPLIVGRLRALSTTHTNEFVASHGYIICMMKGVEDYPPDRETHYHGQLTNELSHYDFIVSWMRANFDNTTKQIGLMGFSGSGFSQLLAPMAMDKVSAVALIESGVFLDGVGEILERHPLYNASRFNAPLLFIYNKQKFEKSGQKKRFDALASDKKQLLLVDFPEQHHWDFATEGTIASAFLENRESALAEKQLQTFKEMNREIVKFFDLHLKHRSTITVPAKDIK